MLFHSKCLKMIEHTVTNAKSQHVVYHNDVIFKLYYDVIYQADVGLNTDWNSLDRGIQCKINENSRN